MKRSSFTWLVDLAAFVGMIFLVATGFLLRYAVPAGSGSLEALGRGPRAGSRPITLMLGLTRHEWGEVHFWIAVGLMGILVLHLVMHGRWIVYMLRGEPRDTAGWRIALGIMGLLGLVAVAMAPFLIPTERETRLEIERRRTDGTVLPQGPAPRPSPEEGSVNRAGPSAR